MDTGVLLAAADRRDGRHTTAADFLRHVEATDLFTTNHIFIEAWGMLRDNADFSAAEQLLEAVQRSPLRIEAATPTDFERACAIGENWADQEFDLVNRTSFAVMERLRCRRVATFDSDFAIYRFGRDRASAFEILP